MGKGERERAEVSRSRAATSHLSCRRGQSWRAGGRWRQSHPVPPPPFGMLFCTPPVTPTTTALFLIPLPYLLHWSHNERFTSTNAENYEQKVKGFSAVSISRHIPRPRNKYARKKSRMRGKCRYIHTFREVTKKTLRGGRETCKVNLR